MTKSAVLACLAAWALSAPVSADEQFAAGKKVFMETAQPSCTICHTLQDAGSAGEIGPNLDELSPTAKQVQDAVARGVGVMPAFSDSLSAEDISAVAHYVAQATKGEK